MIILEIKINIKYHQFHYCPPHFVYFQKGLGFFMFPDEDDVGIFVFG